MILDVKSGVEQILQKYIPENIKNKWRDEDYEIKFRNIKHGLKIFSHLDKIEMEQLFDDTFGLILKHKPILFATALNKYQHMHKYKEKAYESKPFAVQSTIGRFSKYLKRIDASGQIIIDAEGKNDNKIRNLIYSGRKYGIEIRGVNHQPAKEDKLERIVNTINFAESHMSAGIQMADVCSRVIWGHFERGLSDRYEQLRPVFDHVGGRTYEPVISPLKSDWR